ncbi:MAG: hypothetical protein ABMA26_21235 [Limisphaerales bacterium]
MKPDINKYIALKAALLNEKAKLEARLSEISKALGQDDSVPAPAPSAPSSPATTTTPGKRTLSEATKAKMRAAHQARWAKVRARSGSAPTAASAPEAKKTKRVISPEAKARMIAGAKKRWAKVNVLKAKSAK